MKNKKTPAVSIRKSVYAMASKDGTSAELTMYGDIYEEQPTNWWGEPVEGQFILLSEFLKDLKQISSCKEITIRMNSYGGDAGASNTIHNRLRELARAGAKLTCIVDGAAMSGGSIIMCACDTVKVNPSSLIMIHKCWQFLWGGYNADELREQATQQDAWDKMQAEVYTRKTGLSATVVTHMMADTTYMTGREAVEKGFADELIEDAEPTNLAASADGRSLYVRGKQIHLAPGMFAPDTIPTVTSEASAPVETKAMRVSALIHETAWHSIEMLQEFEPETYNKFIRRVSGVGTFAHTFDSGDIIPRQLPFAFKSWQEYRDYLLVNIVKPEYHELFRNRWRNQTGDEWYRVHVKEIVLNDIDGTNNANARSRFRIRDKAHVYRQRDAAQFEQYMGSKT